MNSDFLAEIVTIGDEILFGHILDTNTQWLSLHLGELGIKVNRKCSISDSEEEIKNLLDEALSRSDLVILTGGLGPTNDDVTKKALASFFGTDLVLNDDALKDVTAFFTDRGKILTERNKEQAYLPQNCIKLTNRLGTAPGMLFYSGEKIVISLPGVPFEMKALFTEQVKPVLQEKVKTPSYLHKFVKTTGLGESFIADKIKDWEDALPRFIKLAYLPSPGQVLLRLTAQDQENIGTILDKQVEELQKLLGNNIISTENEAIERVIGQTLKAFKYTIASAESCTGGLIGHLITSIEGSSEYYLGGVIAYDNQIKKNILQVKEDTLAKEGAVSEFTVKEMAENVRKIFKSDIGIATSGIAGPGGGSPDKPVGTIWIAYADNKSTKTRLLRLGKDREANIKATAVAALTLVWESLNQKN